METFERRCEHSSQQLRLLAQQVPGTLRQSADEQLRRLPQEVMGSIRCGIEQPVSAYEQRLREAGERLKRASQVLATPLERTELLHKQLIWKVAGITLGSLVLMLAGVAKVTREFCRDLSDCSCRQRLHAPSMTESVRCFELLS